MRQFSLFILILILTHRFKAMKILTTKATLTMAVVLLLTAFISSCGDSSNKTGSTGQSTPNEQEKKIEEQVAAIKQYNIGIGPVTKVEIGPFDAKMAAEGKKIYEMKCQSCHRLEGDRLVGPTFKGVSERRTPEWVMNMVMNTEAMLNEDPEAKSLLELCLVRMPNQNVSESDARNIVEFLRDVEGHKKTWTE